MPQIFRNREHFSEWFDMDERDYGHYKKFHSNKARKDDEKMIII